MLFNFYFFVKGGYQKNYYKIDDEQQGKLRISTEEFIKYPHKQFVHISNQQIKDFKNQITTQYNTYSVMLKKYVNMEDGRCSYSTKKVF